MQEIMAAALAAGFTDEQADALKAQLLTDAQKRAADLEARMQEQMLPETNRAARRHNAKVQRRSSSTERES